MRRERGFGEKGSHGSHGKRCMVVLELENVMVYKSKKVILLVGE